jgi:hypothetical protein
MSELENTIDWDDDPSGSDGGYTRNGGFITPDAMREIVELRAKIEELERDLKETRRMRDVQAREVDKLRLALARITDRFNDFAATPVPLQYRFDQLRNAIGKANDPAA